MIKSSLWSPVKQSISSRVLSKVSIQKSSFRSVDLHKRRVPSYVGPSCLKRFSSNEANVSKIEDDLAIRTPPLDKYELDLLKKMSRRE